MSEESSSKKEEEIFGIPVSKLGGPALGVAAVGVVLGLASLLRPQIEALQRDLQMRQAYSQQAQLAAAQEQQRQLQLQQQRQTATYNDGQPQEIGLEQQAQLEQPQQSVVDPQYAIEQDPFSHQHPRKVRIPEVEADGSGQNRFNNISI